MFSLLRVSPLAVHDDLASMRRLERKIRCLDLLVGYETALPVFPLAAWSVYGRYTGYPPTAVSHSHPGSCFFDQWCATPPDVPAAVPPLLYEIPEGGVGKGQCMTDSRLRPYSQYSSYDPCSDPHM